MAEIVRRRSFGAVLPLGRHISISGSRPIQCASDSIALSSFQEEQNARHYKQFKFEQALAPNWAHYPLIGLATLATVIASQAVITGAFSLTQQAIQLGLLPRLRVI